MAPRDLQIWRHERSFRELISLVQILFGPALAAGRSRLHAHYLFDTGIVIGGPIFGWIIGRAGYSEAYLAAAGLVAAGSAIFAVWDRQR